VFEPRGWGFGEGPGEWASIVGPGDGYFSSLKCRLIQSATEPRDPIELAIEFSESLASPSDLVLQPRLSLVHVNRDRERTNLAPWSCHLPQSIGEDAISLASARRPSPNTYIFDLTQLRLRGGWTPGSYHFSVRVQNCHPAKHWTWSSRISPPLRLEVINEKK
jgi:hypothetical protein